MSRAFGRLAALALLIGILMPLTASVARAAVAEFFWAGFHVSDPHLDGRKYGDFLSKNVDRFFRSRNKGAVSHFLGSLQWDEFAYFETAASTGYVKENMRDVYGVFISIDRVMHFRPSTVDVGGRRSRNIIPTSSPR